ncbi:MAG: hypothetical protein WCZ28_13355 [Burkholderiaceae bacterium]
MLDSGIAVSGADFDPLVAPLPGVAPSLGGEFAGSGRLPDPGGCGVTSLMGNSYPFVHH